MLKIVKKNVSYQNIELRAFDKIGVKLRLHGSSEYKVDLMATILIFF